MPFDIPFLDYLDKLSPPEMWGIFSFIGLILARTVIKLITGGKAGAGSSGGFGGFGGSDSAASKSSDSSGSGSSSGGESAEQEKQAQSEKQNQQEKQKTEQEKVKELFEMFNDAKEKPFEHKNEEEKQIESLGLNVDAVKGLREKYEQLMEDILELSEHGLRGSSLVKALTAKTADQVPVMELQSLIDAMQAFLEKSDSKVAVVGMDPDFERKTALSALMRGDYETAFDFLERQANEAENIIAGTRRGDIREEARQDAAEMYRAIAVLSRPLNPQKSFDALLNAERMEPEDSLTQTMIGRAYEESGKPVKAAEIYDNAVELGEKDDKASEFAKTHADHIRLGFVMGEANRIRQNYENKLGADTIRTVEKSNLIQDFVREELQERAAQRIA